MCCKPFKISSNRKKLKQIPAPQSVLPLSVWSYESWWEHVLLDSLYLFCSTFWSQIMHPELFHNGSFSRFLHPVTHSTYDSFRLLCLSFLRGLRVWVESGGPCHCDESTHLLFHPFPPSSSHQFTSLPLVKMRNATVHSRLNEVNIAGMLV